GYVKNTNCPKTEADCVPCKSGEEFMDHINDLDECMRCHSCDRMLGWEVAKNCTPTENTECACAKNYYCSSPSCTHCESCTICENGLVEKECNSTSDTVCGMQGTILKPSMVCHLLSSKQMSVSRAFISLFMLLDVDLSHHIPDIVEKMTLDEVMAFVRHHLLPEPTIDEVLRDNWLNTSEQKIKLFQRWYQRHGMKGAYGTLISSLRDLKMRAVADKIEEKLKTAASSHQEKRLTYNDKMEQSKTCSQEGGKSSCNNAELSKTCPDSLEET
ncbi:TNR6 factor, partial [Odontophorus gujanensis]|nr:TNR6 factor [Odontophorus gujanensis]